MFEKKGYIVVEKSEGGRGEAAGRGDRRRRRRHERRRRQLGDRVVARDATSAVLDAVKGLGIEPAAAEVAMLPKNYIKLEGKAAQQMLKLMEVLEEHEDTKKVWTNADIEEKEIEASLA